MQQEAIQYNFEMYNQIHQVCAPLENFFGINLIHYRRFYLNGGLISLFNHLEWMKISFENKFWHSSVFRDKLRELQLKKTLYYLWPTTPVDKDPIYTGLYDNNIWNGVTIYKKHDDCIETYAFATTKENTSRRGSYFSEIDMLEHFILYFRSRMLPMVSPNEKQILIPYQLDLSIDIKQSAAREQFLNETSVKDYYLRLNGVDAKLTKREEECLSLLAQGKRVKEIANLLGLSPRTIETYVENTKQKTNCGTTAQLIGLYQKSSPDYLHYLT